MIERDSQSDDSLAFRIFRISSVLSRSIRDSEEHKPMDVAIDRFNGHEDGDGDEHEEPLGLTFMEFFIFIGITINSSNEMTIVNR
jgi:hypothetical protein